MHSGFLAMSRVARQVQSLYLGPMLLRWKSLLVEAPALVHCLSSACHEAHLAFRSSGGCIKSTTIEQLYRS